MRVIAAWIGVIAAGVTFALVALKVFDLIAWSWWKVTAPAWVTLLLALAYVIAAIIQLFGRRM